MTTGVVTTNTLRTMARIKPFNKTKTCQIVSEIFPKLGLRERNPGVFDGEWREGHGPLVPSIDPSTNEVIAHVQTGTVADLHTTINKMKDAGLIWRAIPAPKRGEIVRQMREALAIHLTSLGKLVSLETGKIMAEGVGEIQEYLDICDYAVGLSRMLNGQVIPSERPGHMMMEMWNPLGIVGVISAFNFPAAVYGWNSAIALVCGNVVLWKGSPATNLTSLAISRILAQVLEQNGLPGAICSLVTGDAEVGQAMSTSPDVALLSFTGSTRVGRQVGEIVQRRFGKSLLELGGNNAIVVMDDANLDLAVRATLFAAVGTAGQRCTTARRLILHERIYDEFITRLKTAYEQINMGSPFDDGILCGPLQNTTAVETYRRTIEAAVKHGGEIIFGGQVIEKNVLPGNFVIPTLIAVRKDNPVAAEEAFVPISFIIRVANLKEAIKVNNSAGQGLSSSLFTESLENVFTWTGYVMIILIISMMMMIIIISF